MPKKSILVPFVCRACVAPFSLLAGRAKGRGVYCSQACSYADRKRAMAKPPNCTCVACGATFHEKPSRIAAGKGRFCSRACDNAWRAREPLWERIWRRVDYGGLGCWEWTGATDTDGYGFLEFEKRSRRATREIWRLIHGRYPVLACHSCDNPRCCRPSHLYDGTPQSNMDDMHRRGRARYVWGGTRGDQIGNSKLTSIQVRVIRERYAKGGVTQVTLAAEYGVAQTAISDIVRFRVWKHVT